MQIKVDEDLPRQVVAFLRENGYQADSVIEQNMAGWKDSELWRKIQTESRFLVTGDKGFANIRIYPPGTHFGVLLLRPDQDGIRPTVELMERVLQNYDLNTLVGSTTVVTPRSVRVRKGV
jgi:predicted nuclease of predicted toxin-antitoxin system